MVLSFLKRLQFLDLTIEERRLRKQRQHQHSRRAPAAMVGYNPHYFHPLPFCGCFVIVDRTRKYIPLVSVKAHTTILATASRTTLTQTFSNPQTSSPLKELRYQFPLYDGVSVVAFTCTVGDRVIKGIVKERQEAKQTYYDAVAKGQTAGLLEQSLSAADVFSTTIGNVPAGAQVKVELTYLGELKHDAEVDGVRFTIPTNISPRYGEGETFIHPTSTVNAAGAGFEVTIDAEMPNGCSIKSIQSPSHPISVQIGYSSKSNTDSDEPSLQRASASLSLGSTQLDKDFVLQVTATKLGEPSAVLETHPTIPNQRALMTTLVPKFNIPADKPEIVFVCDRSGSMGQGNKISNLVNAINIFLRSLPVGVKFNVCSFGSKHEFLWPKSQTYSQETLEKATTYIQSFGANFGGTQMYQPMEETIKKRYKDMNLEIFLLTDGEIWGQDALFGLINDAVKDSKGAVRVFTLGIGRGASHALVEGAARAGNGFSQTVTDDEKMDKKVVRMLKGALTPHVNDYTLEIKYGAPDPNTMQVEGDDDFEIIEKVNSALVITETEGEKQGGLSKKIISLFDSSIKDDASTESTAKPDHSQKYDHLPAIDTPKYLQAPSSIPPLFPFNRTTAYVLLSNDNDTAAKRVPKSVLLKGTSAHGPLELEIPVTVLGEEGETIHQLAARKAVKELEEGRGWITLAKEPGKNGKLLKDKHEGRFSDMVEREAVRLGVKFQVGGKWCSFVAVQENGEEVDQNEEQEKIQDVDEDELEDELDGDRRFRFFDTDAPLSFAPPPPAAPAPMMAVAATGGGGVSTRARRTAMPKMMMAEPQSFSRSDVRALSSVSMEEASHATPAEDKRRRNTAASARSSIIKKKKMAHTEHESVSSALTSVGGAPRMAAPAAQPSGSSQAPGGPKPTAQDPLQAITSLQSFSGAWNWSHHLEALTGVTHTGAKKAVEVAGLQCDGGDMDAVLGTVCALLFMKKKLGAEKDAWEMMADKALMWLEQQLGSEAAVGEWEKALEGLFGA